MHLLVNVWSKQNTLIAKPHGSHFLTSHCLCIVWIDFFHRVPSLRVGVYNHTVFCVQVEGGRNGLGGSSLELWTDNEPGCKIVEPHQWVPITASLTTKISLYFAENKARIKRPFYDKQSEWIENGFCFSF